VFPASIGDAAHFFMESGPFVFCGLFEFLCVLEYLGPFLLAVLLEQGGVEGDAKINLRFCCRPVLVADL
jgi:hypothetical protein